MWRAAPRAMYGSRTMIEPKVKITRRGTERLQAGHLWIYRGDVERRPPRSRRATSSRSWTGRGRFLAKAFWSARSKIALRVVTRDEEPVDEAFFAARLAAAIDLRERAFGAERFVRLVHGEADLLPGSWWTATATPPSSRRSSPRPTGARRSSPTSSRTRSSLRTVVERNDVRVRELEGLAQTKGVLRGEAPGPVEYREGEVRMRIDLLAGQKTGAFLDQRENHLRAGEYARGRCLDCFSYAGGFALHLARRAERVTAVEMQPGAGGAAARERAPEPRREPRGRRGERLRLPARPLRGGARVRPRGARSSRVREEQGRAPAARRGYKEVNLRALQVLRPGGMLVTASCSYHLSEEALEALVLDAANDAGRRVPGARAARCRARPPGPARRARDALPQVPLPAGRPAGAPVRTVAPRDPPCRAQPRARYDPRFATPARRRPLARPAIRSREPRVSPRLAASPSSRGSTRRAPAAPRLRRGRDGPPRTRVHGDGDAGQHLYLVLAGSATLRRAPELALRQLGPGDSLRRARAARKPPPRRDGDVRDAAHRRAPLGAECCTDLERNEPRARREARDRRRGGARRGARARSPARWGSSCAAAPCRAPQEIVVRVAGEERRVRTGTRLLELLPAELDGALVVAGLLGQKPVSLVDAGRSRRRASRRSPRATGRGGRSTPTRSGCSCSRRRTRSRRRSASAWARRAARARWWTSPGDGAEERGGLAARIGAAMERLARTTPRSGSSSGPPTRPPTWFRERGWDDAARLLRIRRQATVRLVSCGEVYALSMGPLLPSTGALRGIPARGREEPGSRSSSASAIRATAGNGGRRRRRRRPATAGWRREHQRWLAAMGVTSVGAFNELCISGQVSQLIRVAEGFHEKRIGRSPTRSPPRATGSRHLHRRAVVVREDHLHQAPHRAAPDRRGEPGRALARRLLRRPRAHAARRGGEWDFEALEAIDLALLQEHVRRLLAGEAVRTARYDFLTGRASRRVARRSSSAPATSSCSRGSTASNPRLLGERSRARASSSGSSSTRRRRCPSTG